VEEGPAPVRVLVVDDQEPFRRAAAAVVVVTPGFVLVGQAASGEDAVEAVGRLAPDLVLMDLVLPGIDGTVATQRIRAAHPAVRVVLLSTYDDVDPVACGAAAFVRKDRFGPDVLAALDGRAG
jgi:DNA-binding NarL/FixJ family response regulator